MTSPPLRELLSDPNALRLRVTDVTVDAETVWVPDLVLERSAHVPTHFPLRPTADRVTLFCAAGRASRTLTIDERVSFVESALGVLAAGDIEPDLDTAVGRYVTTLWVRARLPGLPGDDAMRSRAGLHINHSALGLCADPAWRRLVEIVARELDAYGVDEDRAHGERLRAHFEGRR